MLHQEVSHSHLIVTLSQSESCGTYQRHHVHIEQFGHGDGHLGVESPQNDLDPRPEVGVVAHDVERAVDLEQVAHALQRLAGGGARVAHQIAQTNPREEAGCVDDLDLMDDRQRIEK